MLYPVSYIDQWLWPADARAFSRPPNFKKRPWERGWKYAWLYKTHIMGCYFIFFNFYYQVKTSLKVKVKVSQTCAVPINKINFYVPQQHDAQSIQRELLNPFPQIFSSDRYSISGLYRGLHQILYLGYNVITQLYLN